jgi:hypothetical protein
VDAEDQHGAEVVWHCTVGEETPVVHRRRSSSLISELRRHAVTSGLPMNQNVSRADLPQME